MGFRKGAGPAPNDLTGRLVNIAKTGLVLGFHIWPGFSGAAESFDKRTTTLV
jgi:hypothetical protein